MNALYAFFIDFSHLFKRCGHCDKLHVCAALKELIACTQMQTDKKKPYQVTFKKLCPYLMYKL